MIETDAVQLVRAREQLAEQVAPERVEAALRVFEWHLPFRLPRQTGDLLADLRALDRARLAATTPEQYAACDLRAEQLAERARAALGPIGEAIGAFAQQLGAAFAEAARASGEALAWIAEHLGYAPPPEPADERLGADPFSAAILAKRQRNTGPDRGRLDGRRGR